VSVIIGEVSWERMIRAVERSVNDCCAPAGPWMSLKPVRRAGGNAVAAWASRIDEAAVRNTRDVDLVVRRSDFDTTRRTLEGDGFV
jgi:hypothetical protein